MCAGGCTRVVALILLIVASLALTVHFIAPYWSTRKALGLSYGLWGSCWGEVEIDRLADSLDGCTWFSDDDFKFMKDLESWYYACQGLSAFGMIFLLLAVPAGCGSLCCCKSDRLAYFTGTVTMLACLLMAVSIAVWGWGMHKKYDIVPFEDKTFGKADWAYYMGIGGVVLGWLAGGLFFCSRTRYSD